MSRTAVILPPTPMSFTLVAGLPVIQRIALSALRAGFEEVVAMAGADEQRLQAVFSRDRRTAAIPVVSRGIEAAVETDHVAVIPSDCLVTSASLAQVRTAECDGRPLLFHSHQAPDDPGIVLGPRDLLAVVTGANGERQCARCETAALHPQPASLNGELCLPISDARTAATAEDQLLARLREETAETDGPIARFDRAVSLQLSRRLVRTSLRPNHITLIGTAIGLAGAWQLAQGSYLSGLIGTFLFWLAVIVDGCDGEVARLKFQDTRFGYLFDVTTDNIVHVAIFLGVGIGQYRAAPGGSYEWLVLLLLGGFACALLATYVCLMRHPPVQRLQPRSRRGKLRQGILRGFEALMNRDFAYVLLALAVCDRLAWFLWGAAFGTYVYAAGLFWVYRWRDAE